MTNRDNQVYEFLQYHSCYTDTLCKLFYNNNKCISNRRLKWLTDYGYIKRTRDRNCEQFFYYTGKLTKQKKHMDYIAKIHLWLNKNNFTILSYSVQEKYNEVIPDLTLNIMQTDGKTGLLIAEVELSINNPNKLKSKYELYEKSGIKHILLFSKPHKDSILTTPKMKITQIDIKELDVV